MTPLPLGTIAFAAIVTLAGTTISAKSLPFSKIDRCHAAKMAWDYRAGQCVSEPDGPVDFLVVDKSERILKAYRGEKLIREFKVSLGWGGLKAKGQQGDGRVPEGRYPITYHNSASKFHLSLKIGFPAPNQREYARRNGFNPGGDIMIHGLPNGRGRIGSRHLLKDWTDGCIAVTNREIEWLFEHVPDGTVIDIRA